MRKYLIVGILITLSMASSACPDHYISLLLKHVYCLRKVCNTTCDNQLDVSTFLQDNSGISYSHELTRLTLKQISIQGNLICVFESWDLFLRSYRLVDSDIFLREFSVQLFFIYKNILSRYNSSKVSLAEIMQLSSQIMTLPIDQVLTALERCYNQFMRIMSQYGFQEGMSLSMWLRRYWWVPPVVVISLVYSAFCHFVLNKVRPL